MLSRRVHDLGRPSLSFTIESDELPELPRLNGCYRPHTLEGKWPEIWVEWMKRLDKGWKYVDIEPHGRAFAVTLFGYSEDCPDLELLGVVASVVNEMSSHGAKIAVTP
jgi:hypothetical protein